MSDEAPAGPAFRLFLATLLPVLRPYWLRELEIQIYLLLEMSYELALPLGGKYLLDTVIPSGDQQKFVGFLLVLLLVYMLNPLMGTRRGYITAQVNQNIHNDFQMRVFSHLLDLPHSFYGRNQIGDLVARLSIDMQIFSSAVKNVMENGVYYTVSAAIAAITMFLLNVELAVLVLIVVPISIAGNMLLGSRLQRLTEEKQGQVGELLSYTQEHLSAHPVVKAFNLQSSTMAVYYSRLRAILRVSSRLGLVEAICEEGILLATALGQFVVLGVGGYLVIHKQLTIGSLVAFIGLLPAVFTPVATIIAVGQAVQAAVGALARIIEVRDEPLSITSKPDAQPLLLLTKDIRLQHVTAGYGGHRPILHDLDLVIPAGTHVAVVGPSGSGKSTLINLLMRFWDPEEGQIVFDGHDLRDVTLTSLRDQIGLVSQDAIIFDATVRANIALGRHDVDDTAVIAAAQAARLHDIIMALPEGYDTVLGERGVRLSGGQRQRLSLARVFLRGSQILLLDEATSALDARTEKEIVGALLPFMRGRTTVNITHRLSLAMMADLVVVLDQGRIVEQGPPNELVRAGGLYQRLYEEQMSIPAQDRRRVGAEEARLRAIPLFSGLTDHALAILAEQLTRESVAAGVDVVRQGDPGDKLYIISRGHVDIFVTGDTSDSTTQRRIDMLNEGEYFGEMALLTGTPRTATVRTTMPTDLFSLSREDFLALLDREPELRPILDRKMADRLVNLGIVATTAAAPVE